MRCFESWVLELNGVVELVFDVTFDPLIRFRFRLHATGGFRGVPKLSPRTEFWFEQFSSNSGLFCSMRENLIFGRNLAESIVSSSPIACKLLPIILIIHDKSFLSLWCCSGSLCWYFHNSVLCVWCWFVRLNSNSGMILQEIFMLCCCCPGLVNLCSDVI